MSITCAFSLPMMPKIHFVKTLTAIVALTILVGCSSLPRSETNVKPAKELTAVNQPVVEQDDISVGLKSVEDDGMFIALPLDKNDPLPNMMISPFSTSNATLYDVMRTILEGTKIPFSISTEHAGGNISNTTVSNVNLSGPLQKVMDRASDSVGFYYQYSEGMLHISPDRQFIAKIPPVNEIFDGLPQMLKTLGATSVLVDKTSRTVTYRATKPVSNKVSSYLKWVRDNKKLIVYETYISEVVLDDARNTGIQWNKLSWTDSAAKTSVGINSVSTAATGAIGVGTVYTNGNFAMDALTSFLQTQGTVNQISKIPMMLVSGGQAVFSNGGVDYYVSSLGAPTVTTTGQIIQGQATLTAFNSGVDLTLTGDIYDGTVFTKVDMSMISLTGYKSFPAGNNQTLQAPIGTNRKFSTTVRVRPGDTILIAGVNYEKALSTISGMPGTNGKVLIPTENGKQTQRSELVVVLKPKVIAFSRPSDLMAPVIEGGANK